MGEEFYAVVLVTERRTFATLCWESREAEEPGVFLGETLHMPRKAKESGESQTPPTNTKASALAIRLKVAREWPRPSYALG